MATIEQDQSIVDLSKDFLLVEGQHVLTWWDTQLPSVPVDAPASLPPASSKLTFKSDRTCASAGSGSCNAQPTAYKQEEAFVTSRHHGQRLSA